MLLAGGSSRAMLASARSLVTLSVRHVRIEIGKTVTQVLLANAHISFGGAPSPPPFS